MGRLTTRVLAAAIAAIRPRGHGFDLPLDAEVLCEVREFLAHLPAPLRLGLPAGLLLLELGAPVLAGRPRRFSRLPLADARRCLERLHGLGGPCAGLVLGLRTLVFLAFYQHPAVLARLEVNWAGRAATLTRQRASILDEHSA